VLSKIEIDDWAKQLTGLNPKNITAGINYFGDLGQPVAVGLATVVKKAGWPDAFLEPQSYGYVGIHIGYRRYAPELQPAVNKLARLLHDKFKVDIPIDNNDNNFIVYIGLVPPFYTVDQH